MCYTLETLNSTFRFSGPDTWKYQSSKKIMKLKENVDMQQNKQLSNEKSLCK